MQGRQPGLTGVWTGNKKICAIGVKISHGITTHGLALNYSTKLEYFSSIVPCGVLDRGVTSVSLENPEAKSLDLLNDALTEEFAAHFKYDAMEDCKIDINSL